MPVCQGTLVNKFTKRSSTILEGPTIIACTSYENYVIPFTIRNDCKLHEIKDFLGTSRITLHLMCLWSPWLKVDQGIIKLHFNGHEPQRHITCLYPVSQPTSNNAVYDEFHRWLTTLYPEEIKLCPKKEVTGEIGTAHAILNVRYKATLCNCKNKFWRKKHVNDALLKIWLFNWFTNNCMSKQVTVNHLWYSICLGLSCI